MLYGKYVFMRILTAAVAIMLLCGCLSDGPTDGATPGAGGKKAPSNVSRKQFASATYTTTSTSTSTTLSFENLPPACKSAIGNLRAQAGIANHCSTDADCAATDEFRRCLTQDCYYVVNEKADLSALRLLLKEYDKKCPQTACNMLCPSLPSGGQMRCAGGKCADTKAAQMADAGVKIGEVRECKRTKWTDKCGKCYCLKTDEAECGIIDTAEVGDLEQYMGKVVAYTPSAERPRCARLCPCDIRPSNIGPA
jgi:hypothetical protein